MKLPLSRPSLPDDEPGPHRQSRFGAAPKPAREASALARKIASPPCHLRICLQRDAEFSEGMGNKL